MFKASTIGYIVMCIIVAVMWADINRLFWKQRVFLSGHVAQLEEQIRPKDMAGSSSLSVITKFKVDPYS